MRKTFVFKNTGGGGRSGALRLLRGRVHTPFFMPIATRGAVKHVAPRELKKLGAEIILANTYHLLQRPGMAVLKKFSAGPPCFAWRGRGGGSVSGGSALHRFMGWKRPILTDSGGYQVFSLGHRRVITEKGARFRSEIDGREIFLTPESVIDAQLAIGSDIIMALDECPPYPATRRYMTASVERTLRWASRAKAHFLKRTGGLAPKKRPLLFGIVQGGIFKDLRAYSARATVEIGFDGYAIGGVANGGESGREKKNEVRWSLAHLPTDKPRYLMGVGKPEEIVWAAQQGVDMFDCIIPTREARHGRLYTRAKHIKRSNPQTKFYKTINIRNAAFARDARSVDPRCACPACKHFSRAYLRHLFSVNEPLGQRLATLHNLAFYLGLMQRLRDY